MKIAVIGAAGSLGSSTAFCIGLQNLAEEIKLIDLKKNVVESHVMDMYQGLLEDTHVSVVSADYEDLDDCDVVIITASVPYDPKVTDRSMDLKRNYKIVDSICQSMKGHLKDDVIIITGTNPIETYTYAYYKLLGLKRNQVIGFCAPDMIRMRWAVEEITGTPYKDITGYCVGEHGKAVRLYDQATVKGEPLMLTDEQKKEVEKMNLDWFDHWNALDCGRTTGWTSSIHITKIVKAIAENSGTVLPAAAVLEGEFGFHDVAMDMICRIDRTGICEIVDPQFTQQQMNELEETGNRLKGLQQAVGLMN